MSRDAPSGTQGGHDLPTWLVYFVILGFYLSLRGYHSFDGDLSYRLPLLLHQQDPSAYADDPFVRAFDAFNPHRGSLLALDLVTRPLGLSPGLFLAFILTFGATCLGVDRLARAVWPEAGRQVGLTAVGLLLAAKAGNIGTNHIFEAMVLDRLMAFALGWLALAQVIVEPSRGQWRSMAAIAAATVIHPSVGLQLSLVLAASWVVWTLLGRWMEVSPASAVRGIVGLMLAVLPGLAVNVAPGSSLQGTMPADVFWLLSVELQSPQHMLPHLWRMPQWLAWCCYLILAALALSGLRRGRISDVKGSSAMDAPVSWPAARLRLIAVFAVILIGLGVAWCAIEVLHLVRVTVFQPFRMATLVRGIALVLVSGRLVDLWRRGDWLGRLRAILIAVAFTGDWLLVVVCMAELAVSAAEAICARLPWCAGWRFVDVLVLVAMLALGLNFLGRHDTEYGHIHLLAALAFGLMVGLSGYAKKKAGVAVGDSEAARFPFHPLAKGGAGGGGLGTTNHMAFKAQFTFSARKREGHDSHGSCPHPPWPPLHKRGKGTAFTEDNACATPSSGELLNPHGSRPHPPWPPSRKGGKAILAPALALAWVIPLASLFAAAVPLDHAVSRHPLVRGLIGRCRFAAVPADDIERLGVWCRDHTPESARFIGPPGPKTFRLWSRRSLAFNRAASPYHADGLADWFARFQDHVDFHGSPAEFVRSYVANRHGFEARYEAQSDADRAALAIRQGATFVIATAPGDTAQDASASPSRGPLELLHIEGRYAVYRVNSERLVQRQR